MRVSANLPKAPGNYTTYFEISVKPILFAISSVLVNLLNNYTTDFKPLCGAFYLQKRVIP